MSLYLMYWPITRPLVIFLLPIGFQIDDLTVVFLSVAFIFFWRNLGKNES
jgi:hypothetical protein